MIMDRYGRTRFFITLKLVISFELEKIENCIKHCIKSTSFDVQLNTRPDIRACF